MVQQHHTAYYHHIIHGYSSARFSYPYGRFHPFFQLIRKLNGIQCILISILLVNKCNLIHPYAMSTIIKPSHQPTRIGYPWVIFEQIINFNGFFVQNLYLDVIFKTCKTSMMCFEYFWNIFTLINRFANAEFIGRQWHNLTWNLSWVTKLVRHNWLRTAIGNSDFWRTKSGRD